MTAKRSSQFFGASGGMLTVPTVIHPWNSDREIAMAVFDSYSTATGGGSMTADTYKTVVSLTGGGAINAFAIWQTDATVRTITVRITLDGGTPIVVGAVTTSAVAYRGFVAIGLAGNSDYRPATAPIPFKYSCVIEIKTSDTQSNKVKYASDYRVG